MNKESKEKLEKVAYPVISSLLVVILTALIKGDELRGLSRAAGLWRILSTGVPLWLFIAVLAVAVLSSTSWIRHVVSREKILHVIWLPEHCIWGTGVWGNKALMQLIATAYFTNNSKTTRLLITSAYLKGTRPVLGQFGPIALEPGSCSRQRIHAYVEPLLGKAGKTLKGTFVFVDQFSRKHKFTVELRSSSGLKPTETTAASGNQTSGLKQSDKGIQDLRWRLRVLASDIGYKSFKS